MVLTLILAAIVLIIDQLSKTWAYNTLSQVDHIQAIPNLLDFVYVENTGAAFGIFPNQQWFFITLAVLVLIFSIYFLYKKKIRNKLFSVSMALIIGGTAGNLTDRIFRGFVVDFLRLSFFSPVCNFADYCLTIGAVLLIVYMLFFSSKTEKDYIKINRKIL